MSATHGLWPIVARHIIEGDVFDASSLSKRSIGAIISRAEEPSEGKLTAFKVAAGIQILIVILLMLAFSYTTERVFPTLAAVESGTPESYTELSDNVLDEEAGNPKILSDEEPSQPARPVTSGLISTYRLLLSIGGKKSLFRGFGCFVVYALIGIPLELLLRLIPFMPKIASSIIASLLLMQLNTVWTHAIISKPSAKPFWRRLPPLRLVFRATALPTLIFGVAAGVSGMINEIFAESIFSDVTGAAGPHPATDNILSFSLLLIAQLLLTFLVIIPADAVLVRVQTSLLTAEDRPIVSLDPVFALRKFEGREYVSALEAFKSMTRASWGRLYMLHVKVFLLCILVTNVVCFIGFMEVVIARQFL
ncbi:hypothetical protein F4811DRAFT_50228 [Daldinia bambusicola]|nr:hypothetical protein F4811DRAFT_50228 [Daldinia bambusicola]